MRKLFTFLASTLGPFDLAPHAGKDLRIHFFDGIAVDHFPVANRRKVRFFVNVCPRTKRATLHVSSLDAAGDTYQQLVMPLPDRGKSTAITVTLPKTSGELFVGAVTRVTYTLMRDCDGNLAVYS